MRRGVVLIRRIACAVLVAGFSFWGTAHAVDLRLLDINGTEHRLSDYRGQWVVLNFWATWCPPCLEEIPELVVFHEQHHQDDAVVLGVNFELLNRQKLLSFVDENFIDYPVLPMAPARMTPLGPVTGLPTTYLIGPDGQVAKVHVGAVTASQLESYIAELR